jgi:hypothetical protein
VCRTDYDYPEFFHESRRHARKMHRCVECKGQISAGEVYTCHSGKWDGEIHSHKRCSGCDPAARWMIEHCDGYGFGDLREELEEHLFESKAHRGGKYTPEEHAYRIEIAKLVQGMKRRRAGRST